MGWTVPSTNVELTQRSFEGSAKAFWNVIVVAVVVVDADSAKAAAARSANTAIIRLFVFCSFLYFGNCSYRSRINEPLFLNILAVVNYATGAFLMLLTNNFIL